MIEALEGVTDQDLFNGANADEAPAETPVAEVVEAPAEQPRDDAGRFSGKPEEKPETVVAPAAKEPVDDNAAMVPSWRVREINEEKRSLADKLAALEAERSSWQRQQQEKPKPAEKAEDEPDPLLQPKEFRELIERRVEASILNDRREQSLSRAREANQVEFDEAYTAAQKAIDPALKARMQSSRDPGKTLLDWHRENKTRAEVGNDPNAYFDKRLEAYLSDTANQAKLLERIRGGIQPAGKSPPVSLPPSLTRATAAAANETVDNDISNDGLWRHANA